MNKKEKWVLPGILALSLFIRLISLNQSLWWDEAINVVYAKNYPFWWFISSYPIGDFHPPGWFALLWIWGHLFNFSELSVRFPSVLLAVLTVFITYLIGKNLFDKRIGLLAALFLTVAPLHIYYSQEARMYSLAAFSAAFSTYSLIRLLNNQRWGLYLYIVSVVLVLYSDYLAYFILIAHFLWMIIYQKKILKKYLVGLSLGIIFLMPWLLIFPQQFLKGQASAVSLVGWRNVVGGATLKELILLPVKIMTGRISIDNDFIYVLVVLFLTMPFVISLIQTIKKRNSKINLLWCWLVFPPLISFLISLVVPIFSFFRLIFILPAFYLLIAVGISSLGLKLFKTLTIFIIIFEIVPSFTYLLNPQFHREDWKSAIQFIKNNLDTKSVVMFEYNEIPTPLSYYGESLIPSTVTLSNTPVSKSDLVNLDKKLGSKRSIYLFEYLADITDPQRLVEGKLASLGYKQTRIENFRGVGFVKILSKD